MLDRDRARRLAETALRASAADETEVVVEQTEQELNRFTADHPVQNLVRLLSRVSVRVRVDGHEGKASTGSTTDDAIRRTVERATAVARMMPRPATDLLPMAGRQEYTLRNREAVAPDPDATAKSVASMTARARGEGCRAAGIQSAENELRLVMNSRGLDVSDLDTRAEISFTVFKDDGAGWATGISHDRSGVSEESIAERAVTKALRSRNAVAVKPGHWTVILEPPAVASLLLFASYKGFGAQQVEEGSSFLAGKIGQKVVGDGVSIADDCHHPLAVGHTFDGEGLPRVAVPLIDRGVATGLVHDRATAHRFGCRSTGHATAQPSSSGPIASNLVLAAGTGSTADLLRGLDRGILVTQFHYTNMVEPTQLTLTGMTRNGTFLIDRGEVANPVKNMRFTQSLVEALRRVTGIAGDASLASALFGGYTVVPSVRIEGFHFSSGTEF
ncbi:MAG: TldD/PmbA family protein [Planctomycetes bacterium]|nr:TldD/PmbA family protein [Planctomycetota bacterium]